MMVLRNLFIDRTYRCVVGIPGSVPRQESSPSASKKGSMQDTMTSDVQALAPQQLEEQRSRHWTVYSFSMQCQLNEVEHVYHYDIQPGELLEVRPIIFAEHRKRSIKLMNN